ncbi:hypothetical protein EV121DRAFT_256813 [Schizophyllum commune]
MTREARRRRLYLALAGLLVYVRGSGSGDECRNVRLWIHRGCQAERRTGQPAGGRKFRKQRTFPEKETSAFSNPRDLGFAPPKARTYVELALRPHDHVAKIVHNSSQWTACRLGGTGAEQASARRWTGLPWNQCTPLLLRCFLGVPGALDVRAHAVLEAIACALGVPARTISETRPELRDGNLVWDD